MDVLYQELLEALQAEGCAACRLARRASDSYLRALIYEGVTDVKLREALRDARGVCARHARRMSGQPGAVLGTAIIYRDVINTLVRVLEANTSVRRRPLSRGQPEVSRALAASAGCPACILERDAEQRAAKILLSHLQDQAVADAYLQAGGFCLPHFRLCLDLASHADSRVLIERQAAAWRRLRAELDELIRKHDYRFRTEPMTEAEAHAWERAVASLVGEEELAPRS